MKDIVSELIAHAESKGYMATYINDTRYMSEIIHGMDLQREDIFFGVDFPRTNGDVEMGSTQSMSRSFTFILGRKSELETSSSIGELPISKWDARLGELSTKGLEFLSTFFTGCNQDYTLKSWSNNDQINETSTSMDFVVFDINITEWIA